ncbi:hypothetical protein Trydic_g14237 [Trypoxylus dichotomus]
MRPLYGGQAEGKTMEALMEEVPAQSNYAKLIAFVFDTKYLGVILLLYDDVTGDRTWVAEHLAKVIPSAKKLRSMSGKCRVPKMAPGPREKVSKSEGLVSSDTHVIAPFQLVRFVFGARSGRGRTVTPPKIGSACRNIFLNNPVIFQLTFYLLQIKC